jgi:methionine-S-sulfoxide reductase
VCTARSGHTEAIQITYDPKTVSFDKLLEVLFQKIDPTLLNQVGNDRGPQYRHGVYPHTPEQKQAYVAFLERVKGRYNRPIVTECVDATVFWPAEEYHQQYLQKGGQSAEKGSAVPIRCYG